MLAAHLVVLGGKGHQLACSVLAKSEHASKVPENPNVWEGNVSLEEFAPRGHRGDPLMTSRLHGFSKTAFARLCIPKRELGDRPLIFTIDRILFLSFPTLAKDMLFSVVFTFDASEARFSRIEIDVEGYLNVTRRLSIAIREEQDRCQFLSRHVDILSDIDSQVASLGLRDDLAFEELRQRQRASSSLVRNLEKIVKDFSADKKSCTVLINDWISVSFCLKHESVHTRINKKLMLNHDTVYPYQSLLLLASPVQIISELPKDYSPDLLLLIRRANPMKSFQELSFELDIPLRLCFRLALHLVYWGKAHVIDTLSKHNVYVMAHDACIGDSFLENSFANEFDGFNLYEILAKFSEILKLEDHLRAFSAEGRKQFLSMLVWLLQYNMIVQMRTYVYCLLDSKTDKGAVSASEIPRSAQSLPSLKDFTKTSHQGSQRMFTKLLPFFNGSYHIEEIMRKSRVSRSDIMKTLSEYRDVLVTCMYSKSL